MEYSKKLTQRLKDAGLRAELDGKNEKIGYKIREAQLQKIPYMLVTGEKEAESGTVSVRSRKGGNLGTMKPEEFIGRAQREIRDKTAD